ncbi:hypothetical protein CASFOL_037155 [Castilleja foliolosa]|uniref:BHLH domain-containing protein n=1 Tax=Castilleja foliolosa TaxID=1961234 RepID=A0ABD3BNT3_9LAMI
MNSSVISWMSPPPVMNNSTMTNNLECDNLIVDSSFDDEFAAMFGQDFLNYSSPRSNTSNSSFYNTTSAGLMEQSELLHQPENNYSYFSTDQQDSSSVPIILSFGSHNPTSQNILQQVNPMQSNYLEENVVAPEKFISQQAGSYNVSAVEEAAPIIKAAQPTKKKARTRPPSQTYDHIIAERRRREQLSQLFVALSALVPGLKKMDKSSVLEDAIKYLKHLKERVITLEEKSEKRGIESVVFIKKSQIFMEDEGSSNEQSCSFDEQPLPEIEARACENHMLLRVHCENQKGIFAKLLSKVESLNMIVVNTNATPFGNVALDITIIAEGLEKEFNLTGKEVVTALREALKPRRA